MLQVVVFAMRPSTRLKFPESEQMKNLSFQTENYLVSNKIS
ncbi:hypothetical protein [Nostoc sp. WHI]|nr:hypothetical protein [Nostoc sp. WHI]